MEKTDREITIRSSAAEYLIYAVAAGDDLQNVEIRYEDENIWLTQKSLATLYDVEVNTVNYHIKKILEDRELLKDSVIRKFRITAADGKSYYTNHYDLQVIISVGFKVNSGRAVQFRKWVNHIAKEYTIKGWILDKERLKNSGSVLSQHYFEQLLEDIREIRLSERKFYQKITDIYAMALDYDKDAKITYDFFSTVQNKLHWAIHKHTAAELIVERANADKINMGLNSWQNAPKGKIKKSDVSIAKNYLSKDEIFELERIVSAYLDLAEVMAKRHIPMTMQDWNQYLSEILKLNKFEILNGKGRVSAEQAKQYAESEFEKYRIIQDQIYQSDFDRFIQLEQQIK
jgi:hypothetical protein